MCHDKDQPIHYILRGCDFFCFGACAGDDTFKLALVDHAGQLSWAAEGFKVTEYSAKPNGREIGIRGQDPSGRLTFLGFLFLFPEEAPLTSAKCRDGVIGPEKKSNATLKILDKSEVSHPGNLPVSLVSYTVAGEGGKTLYTVRGFIANGDICGDLELYSYMPIKAEDTDLKKIFAGYHFDENMFRNSTICCFTPRSFTNITCTGLQLRYLRNHWLN